MRALAIGVLLSAFAAFTPAAKNLEVYAIDTEGGKATLYVSPSGESMLVDAGYAGFYNRDANRIAMAAKLAGVKQIDYLVITHYHADHVGGVPQLAAKFTIRNFVDHGPAVENDRDTQVRVIAYNSFRDKGNHILAEPGALIPIKGIEVRIVTSAGKAINQPLAGAGQPNPLCATYKPLDQDQGENARSIGILITYGKFRLVDLGDLFWNQERDLACPNNKLGTVDAYMTTHHGGDKSNLPQLVWALHPKVAIMNNGPKKGGTPAAWQTIHDSPGLLDIWQLHFSEAGGKEHNSPDPFLANLDEACQGQWIRLIAQSDGAFTVYNSRNKYEKTYH